MDTISLALALKALKNSSGGEGGSDIDFIHEVDDLNITEAETGIYKVNGRFYTYNGDQTLNLPNVVMTEGTEISMIAVISKYIQPNLNNVVWDWLVISGANNMIRYGSVTETTDPNTEAVTYNGRLTYAETAINKTNIINNTNKTNQTQYPSVKAVADYVDNVLTDITETQY